MSGPGYGRGGRGDALKHALAQMPRQPGQTPTSTVPAPSTSSTLPLMMGRGGRGAYNLSLQVAQQQTLPQPKPIAAPSPTPSVGRGIAAGRGVTAFGRGILHLSQNAFCSSSSSESETEFSRLASSPSPATTSPSESSLPSGMSTPKPIGIPSSGSGSISPSSLSGDLSTLHITEKPVLKMVGTSGQRIPVKANCIRVKSKIDAIFQYQVYFTPQIDSKGMRYRLLYAHSSVIGEVRAFDGSILFLPKKLDHVETVFLSTRPTDDAEIRVIVKLVKIIPPHSELCMPVYNVIFRRVMNSLNLVQVGRHNYDPKRPQPVPQHKLEVWPGYITAIKEHEGGLMLLTDVSHRVLRTETVLDLIADIANHSGAGGLQDQVLKAVVGCTVLTRYNNKTYIINDIAWDKNPTTTFKTSKGEISFSDYYKKNYNKEITDLRQPLLIHIPKQPKNEDNGTVKKLDMICLIPEFSYMTGLNDKMRADFRVMKDIATHTRVTPAQREVSLKKFIQNVTTNTEASKLLSDWGLELSKDTLSMEARLLPPEKINFGNKSVSATEQADWGRELRNRVINAVPLSNWMVLYTKRDAQKVSSFVAMYGQVAPSMGINCTRPTMIELSDDRTETYIRKIRESLNKSVQCVVTVFPTSRDDRYNAVKKLTTIECPVASQVIIGKTIGDERKLRSVTQKIALQINCKMGGELWAVDIPVKNLMVIGIDVYHDKASKGSSWLGFVSSMNSTCTSWYSKVQQQLSGQELGDKLKCSLTASLRKYHSINGVLPDRIIVYRDGVGDGRLAYTADYEVRQLADAFHDFGDSYNPKLGFIVVSKRINTRIFAQVNNGLQNPGPGTIVDHEITRRNWFDFFLISQHVRQGTVSPTHYIVIHDNSGLKPDHLQKLSYKMTHLYYNWPGTVRVPAPCQYAHKLAYLVGQNTHKEHSEVLSDRLFFL